jgi:5'-3' exonuclease
MDVLQSLNKIVKDFTPTKLIIAIDAGNYWRTSYYKEYKENRKSIRQASIINFDVFFKVLNEFTENLKTLLSNVCFLTVPTCEADDLIAVLTKYIYPNDEVICISTDRDMYQLLQYQNYKQYNAVKHQYIECLDPKTYLLTKIMTGDRGDNIPNVKKGIGKVHIAKILSENLDTWLDSDKINRSNFERNFQLISFEAIPSEIVNQIIKTYNEYQYKKFIPYNFFNFLIKEKISSLSYYVDTYATSFNTITINNGKNLSNITE